MEFNKRQMHPFKSEPISDLTEVYTGTDLVLTTLYELSGFHGDSRWKQGDQGKSGWLHVAPHHGCFRLIGPGWTWYNLMIPNAGKNAKGFDWSFHEFPPPSKKKIYNLVHTKGFKLCVQPSTLERHSEHITRLTHRSQSLQSRPNKAIVISAMRKFIVIHRNSHVQWPHIAHDCMSIEDDSTVHLESTVELLGWESKWVKHPLQRVALSSCRCPSLAMESASCLYNLLSILQPKHAMHIRKPNKHQSSTSVFCDENKRP